MPVTRRRPPEPVRFKSGPWNEVVTTTDPFDGGPTVLLDAYNIYIPDPNNGSGAYQRPGMFLANAGQPVTTSANRFTGQGTITYTDLSLQTYNFTVFNGELWRTDAQFGAFEDVTPAGITIDSSVTTRVYGTAFGAQLVITDGVNKPWIASNLSASPITGTDIQFNASNDDWSVFGPFVEYAGSVIAILNEVDGVAARTDIVWSAPGDAATGYQQATYDFRWTLQQAATQTQPPALFALAATNTQLYYFREFSIGSLSGVPGPNFQGQATHDAISANVGTMSPQSVVQFDNTVFFTDALGRPYRLVPGLPLEPLWLKMRQIVDGSSIGFPGINRTVCTGAFEPTNNLYIVAPWSFNPAQTGPSVQGYVFDARTGRYFGRFKVGPGVQIETLGTFVDQNGRGVLIVLGSLVAPTDQQIATSGYVWCLNGLEALGETMTTEGGVELTTEDDVLLTTEGTETNWLDNDELPDIRVITQRLGYSAMELVSADRVTALVAEDTTVEVSAETAAVAITVEGTPTPSTTQDGVGKIVAGFSGISGRGVSITLSPTEAETQWSAQQVILDGVLVPALPDDA